jgi:hypothetical protein
LVTTQARNGIILYYKIDGIMALKNVDVDHVVFAIFLKEEVNSLMKGVHIGKPIDQKNT